MPTAAELAAERQAAKMRRSGLDPEGNPLEDESGLQEGEEIEQEPTSGSDDEIEQEPAGAGTGGSDDEVERLRQELQQTREEFSSLRGRLAPTQQDLEHYRQETRRLQIQLQAREAEREREIEELRKQLEERSAKLDVNDLLTEEERADLDPALLNTVVKLADEIAKRRAPKVDVKAEALRALEERDQQRVRQYRDQVLVDPGRGLHQLHALSTDPRFIAWTKEDDNDLESTLNSLLSARSTEEVDRYARIASRKIAQFNAQSKAPTGARKDKPAGADANTRLHSGMRRQPDQRLNDAQRNDKLAEAKRLARGSAADRKKAQAILDSL